MSEEFENPGQNTRDSLISFSVEVLRNHGAAALRTAGVVKSSDSSFSSLYHHFKSRDDLIRVAATQLIHQSFSVNLKFDESFESIQNFDQFCHLIASTFNEISVNPHSIENRRMQATLIGLSTKDPYLREKLKYYYSEIIGSFSHTIQSGIDRGIDLAQLSPSSFSILLHSLINSRTFIENDIKLSVVLADWNKYILWAMIDSSVKKRNKVVWNPLWGLRINNPLPVGEDRNQFTINLLENRDKSERSKVTIRKTEIIEQTINFLESRSEENVKVGEVAHECNIAPSGVYKYFPDKNQLIDDSLITLLNRVSEHETKHITALLTSGGRKKQIIAELLDYYTNQIADESVIQAKSIYWRVIGRARTNEQLSKEFISNQDNSARQFISALSHLQEKKFISKEVNAISIAYLLIGIEHSLYLSLFLAESEELESIQQLKIQFLNFVKSLLTLIL